MQKNGVESLNSLPRYEGYAGSKVWEVRHPHHGTKRVNAPSWQAAIVVAAKVWGEDWRAYDFYTNCATTYEGTEKGIKK